MKNKHSLIVSISNINDLDKITKDTKAIIPVHYGGCPCKIREFVEYRKQIYKNLQIVYVMDSHSEQNDEVKLVNDYLYHLTKHS